MKPHFPQTNLSLSELYQSEIKYEQPQEQMEQVNSSLKFKFDPNFSGRKNKEELMFSQFVNNFQYQNPQQQQLNKSSILEEYQMELQSEKQPIQQQDAFQMNSNSFSSQLLQIKQPFKNQQFQQNQLSFLNSSSFKATPMNLPLIGSRIISPIGGKRQASDLLRQQFQKIRFTNQPEENFQLSLFYYEPQIGITYCLLDDIFITTIDQGDIKKINLILNDYNLDQLNVYYSSNIPQQLLLNLKQIVAKNSKAITYEEIVNYDIQETLQEIGCRNSDIYDENVIDKQIYINLCSALPVMTKQNLDTILNLLTANETRCKLKFNDELLNQLGLIKIDNQLSIQQLFEKYFQTLQAKKLFNQYLRSPISSQQILMKRFNYLSCFYQLSLLPSNQKFIKMPQKIGSFAQSNLQAYVVLKSLANYQERSEPYKKLFVQLNILVEFISDVKGLIIRDRISQQQTCKLLKDLSNLDIDQIQNLIQFIESSLIFNSNSQEIKIKEEKYPQFQKLLQLQQKVQIRIQLMKNKYLSELALLGIKPEKLEIENIDGTYFIAITTQFNIRQKLQQLDWYHREDRDEEKKMFFQTQFTEELDLQYGNLEELISSMREQTIIQIVGEILSHQELLEKIEQIIGEIDYYIGLSMAITQMKLCIPNLNNKNQINIQGGRHLLVEEAKGNNIQFQPNDFSLNDKRIFLIVGPNFSGKSVFIRQIGIILYLAHCGLPVPAVKADIHTLEEIHAAFPCEGKTNPLLNLMDQQLVQIKSILQVSSRSLVLMDEIGKNFKYQVGSNLHKSALEFFGQMKPQPPIVLSATHYQNHEDMLAMTTVAQGEMEVILEQTKNLIFIYRINFNTQRNNKQSFGLEVALMVHQNEDLYHRGLQLYELLTKYKYLQKCN